MSSKNHNGTASSFLDAIVQLGTRPDTKSVDALLESFMDLDFQEQAIVIQSPKVNQCPITTTENSRIKTEENLVLGFSRNMGYGRRS